MSRWFVCPGRPARFSRSRPAADRRDGHPPSLAARKQTIEKSELASADQKPGDADAAETCALTVYFDGSCLLCSAEIRHYTTRQGAERIAFQDVSAPGADPGPGLTQRQALRRFHVRRADGTILSGARAFATVWDTLPGWRPLGRLARIPGVLSLLEVGYRLFLPVRPALSRLLRAAGMRPLRD